MNGNTIRIGTGRALVAMLALGVVAVLPPAQARAGLVYNQGFETDTSGWYGPVSRVASGANGVASEAGNFHAQAAAGAYTDWGGYSSMFPTGGGYTTSLGIYLDLNQSANDIRFDWTSAINKTDGTHLRDFAFNGGFYNDSDATGTGARFVFSASNSAGRGSAYPKNPGRDPFAITTTGWYDFQQSFYDNAGFLAVDLSIIDHATSTVLKTWTLTTTDAIAGVGGNRYGWFAQNEFASLAVDNATLQTAPEPSTLVSSGLAVVLCLGAVWRQRRRQSAAA